ncbi:hypothetical protein ANRL1_01828 [Anaerolineae bacterium]|nr:hypothetical protein ANRL1_01828 [Anaerolineae bacterium]
MPKTFGQRKGLKPIKVMIQTDSMDSDLKNALWNVLTVEVWYKKGFMHDSDGDVGNIWQFGVALWANYFNLPIDEMPRGGNAIIKEIRNHFFNCSWFEVYEFLEFVVGYFERESLTKEVNSVLEQELSGYRCVGGVISDITNPQEIEMLEEAVGDSDFPGVRAHLQRALELFSDRKNPDYRNSIKESISAVESLARALTELPKATLGDALKQVEITNNIHPALKDSFLKLYGYTSDEQGIRHAMLDEPNITAADARYFLLSCTSFVNYLKAKTRK